MAILDLIKEIPLSAVYKERLVEFEKQFLVLERKVIDLETEKLHLNSKLEQSEQDRRTLEKQIIEINQLEDLIFNEKTGTCISNNVHYCNYCKLKNNLRSPLQTKKYDRFCTICDKSFSDPDMERKHTPQARARV